MHKILIKLLALVLMFFTSSSLIMASCWGTWEVACASESNWCTEWENCLTSTDFVFNLTGLIWWTTPENEKSVKSVNVMITRIVELALIAIVFIAASLIVVWWVWMASSWWNSERINRWKTIITYNIIAIVVALMAYIMVSVVRWLVFNI